MHRLGGVRMISTLTRFALAVEIGDGCLIALEHSSGASQAHRARYVVGKTMRDRWDLAPRRYAGTGR